MLKILLSVIITLIVIAVCFWLYIISGSYDISQLQPHNALTKWMINTTKEHSIDARIKDIQVPKLDDSAMFATGFSHYNEMCVSCHGAPGAEAWEMRKGLYPKPPLIYKFKEELDPKETFWIIKNGIKMTSMPAFGPTQSDYIIWSMTAFLTQKLTKMSPEEYKSWSKKYVEKEEEESSEDHE